MLLIIPSAILNSLSMTSVGASFANLQGDMGDFVNIWMDEKNMPKWFLGSKTTVLFIGKFDVFTNTLKHA